MRLGFRQLPTWPIRRWLIELACAARSAPQARLGPWPSWVTRFGWTLANAWLGLGCLLDHRAQRFCLAAVGAEPSCSARPQAAGGACSSALLPTGRAAAPSDRSPQELTLAPPSSAAAARNQRWENPGKLLRWGACQLGRCRSGMVVNGAAFSRNWASTAPTCLFHLDSTAPTWLLLRPLRRSCLGLLGDQPPCAGACWTAWFHLVLRCAFCPGAGEFQNLLRSLATPGRGPAQLGLKGALDRSAGGGTLVGQPVSLRRAGRRSRWPVAASGCHSRNCGWWSGRLTTSIGSPQPP